MEKIKRFFKEEEGLEMSEYALMGAMICLAVIVALTFLRGTIANALTAIGTAINSSSA